MSEESKARKIEMVCRFLAQNESEAAAKFLQTQCPSDLSLRVPKVAPTAIIPSVSKDKRTKRKYSASQATRLFRRDKFTDRYTGELLIFPGVLRLLSHLFPSEFPYHPAWKFGVGHSWYWELFPSVDHIIPVTHAGADTEENWVTTSFIRNLARSNYSLTDLGWIVRPIETSSEWDGLIHWYRSYVKSHPELKNVAPLRHWLSASQFLEAAA